MSFDQIIDRTGTHSAKWDMMEPLYGVSPKDGIAMWVADMDFRLPASVQAALEAMVSHGIYGYFGDDRAYLDAIRWWMAHRHGWQVEREWIFTAHGLVNGAALCVDAFTEAGDGVVLMTPVYHAFARVIKASGRRVVECELAIEGGRYVPDFAAWDAMMTGAERMMILCSPHNPGGRVWTAEELRGIADFARRHDLILVSDEIHCDLVFKGGKHTPTLTAAPGHADRIISCFAATKTFNLAGAHVGACVTPNAALKKRLDQRIAASGLGSYNAFGMLATEAAWRTGEAWLDELLVYLAGNRDLLDRRIEAMAPGARSMRLASTYLAWVDFAGTGLAPKDVAERVKSRARIFASPGEQFGPGGESWLRFNFATPRPILNAALGRLEEAFADLRKRR